MRRFVPALAALPLALTPLAATADPPPLPPDRIVADGGCGWFTVERAEEPDTHSGVLYGHVRFYSPNPLRNPVTIEDAKCVVTKHGATVTELPLTAAGPVAAGAGPVTLTNTDTDLVHVCASYTVVDALGDRHSGWTHCNLSYPIPWWQTWSVDVLDWALDETFTAVDPVACAAIAAQPHPPNDVYHVDDEGDVYVFGELFWDCPPYESTG
ncbi:MAG TPA: hypothetical protein VNA20_00820 [Frankiaceae bacterium]|nr:hypothetical protein [Frankiaceae bacterium]